MSEKTAANRGRDELLLSVPEEDIVFAVRTTLERARDWYALRGRKILSVDLQTHLDFFEEAIMFDRVDQNPVPVSKRLN